MILNQSKVSSVTAATLPDEDQQAIRALRERLVFLGIPELLAAYGSECERPDALRFDLALLPTHLSNAIKFFVLGDAVDSPTIETLFSTEVTDMLLRRELAHQEGESLQLTNLRLVYHYGVLVFCEREAIGAKCYYGNDSLALGRLLLPAQGRALDLCTGVGTQGLLCALTADEVVVVEREPSTARLFVVNAVLNGVEKKIEMRQGNLLEPVQDERFDRVCCNPPLLPIPGDLPYPPTGHGGPDGLIITKQILAALPDLLTPHGRCHIVGTLLGNKTAPDLSVFEELAANHGLSIQLILPNRQALEFNAPMLRSLAETISAYGALDVHTVAQQLYDAFNTQGASHLYSFLLSASLVPEDKQAEVIWTGHYLRNKEFWTV